MRYQSFSNELGLAGIKGFVDLVFETETPKSISKKVSEGAEKLSIYNIREKIQSNPSLRKNVVPNEVHPLVGIFGSLSVDFSKFSVKPIRRRSEQEVRHTVLEG